MPIFYLSHANKVKLGERLGLPLRHAYTTGDVWQYFVTQDDQRGKHHKKTHEVVMFGVTRDQGRPPETP